MNERKIIFLFIIALGLVLIFLNSREAKAAASGYGLQSAATISYKYKDVDIAYLWHPVTLGNRMYIGSYTYQEPPTDTANLRIYYADYPYSYFNSIELIGSADHESARPHVLNGELFFITEGEKNKPPLIYRPGNNLGSSVDNGVAIGTNNFLLAATYFDNQPLFGWSKYTGEENDMVEGTVIYNPNGGQWKNFYAPKIPTFHMPVFNDYLYLIGYDARLEAKISNDYGRIIRVDSSGATEEINAGGAQGCYQGVEYNGSLYVGCGSRNVGTGVATIWKLEGNTLVPSKSFSANINNFGSLAVYHGRLYASGIQNNGRSEVMVFDGSTWKTILTQADFESTNSGAGNSSGLNQPGSMLVVANNELYLVDNNKKDSTGKRRGPSYLFKISTPSEPTSCNLNFNPDSIVLGGETEFSWNVTGTITYAFLACDQAGGVEVTSYIQKNPSGSVSGWTPTTAGTETCRMYLNGTTICQSNPLTITEPAPASASCTLYFDPENIDLGQSSTLTWTTTGTFSAARIECDLAGGGDITTFLQANPNDDIAWTPSSEGVETCRIYFNNANTASCESNHLTTTDPAQNSAYRLPKTKQPKLDCAFTPANVALNEKTTLSWEATDIASLKAYCTGLVPIGTIDAQIELPDFTENLPDISLAKTGNEYCYFNAYDSSGVNVDSCTASLQIGTPLPGSCGTAMKTYGATETSWGSATFCSAGNPNPETPTFPATGSLATWICEGVNGGTDAYCTATRENVSVDCIIDDPSCAEKTCQDLYCFDGCEYLQGTKDCVGRR